MLQRPCPARADELALLEEPGRADAPPLQLGLTGGNWRPDAFIVLSVDEIGTPI